MAFRTVIVKNRAKLAYQLNCLVVRGNEERRIHLSEVHTLVVETTAVAVTAVLLVELAKRNIKVIFCDEKYNPSVECIPYYGSHETSKRIKMQIAWNEKTKGLVWKKIIEEKIKNQAVLLEKHGLAQYELLTQYSLDVEENDLTNREGHAAKVYFNSLFGKDFTRSNKENPINIALNYGYSIILSAINRIIVASGYITQLGIWHDNEFNEFNFACDLMEPFRPLVDEIVVGLRDLDLFRAVLNNVLNVNVRINDLETTLSNAITIYARAVFDALNTGKIELICFLQKHEL